MPTKGFARTAVAAALLLAALPAAAQWTGKGEAGLALADGNSDSRTANARVATAYKDDGREYSATLAGLYVRNDGDTTASRWEAGAQTRIDFTGRNFWYGGLRYEEDRFSGFDYQGLATTGVGRRLIDSDRTRLLAQVGVGYKFWKSLDVPAEKDSSATGVANVEFQHQLTGTTSLLDKLGGEFSSGNTFVQNEVAVAVKMTDRMALSIAYAVRHNSKPPAGFKKTDTLTTANLVYEVK